MTAALEGGEWSAARPGLTLPPGKTKYPFYRRLGGPHDRSGRVERPGTYCTRSWVGPRAGLDGRKDPVPIVHEAGWAPGPVWTGGKTRYLFYMRLGGPQGRSGRVERPGTYCTRSWVGPRAGLDGQKDPVPIVKEADIKWST